MTNSEGILISPPKKSNSKETEYVFNLSTSNGEPLVFESECLYDVNCKQNEQLLKIPSKNDLRILSTTFNDIKGVFLKNHDEWFEEKFTSSALDDLFKNFLCPNIVDNCIDLKISIVSEVLDKLKMAMNNSNNVCTLTPTFLYDSIILNSENNKMYCLILLQDFHILSQKKNEIMEEPVEESAAVEESTTGEQPVPVEESVAVEESTTGEQPVPVEESVAVEESTSVEESPTEESPTVEESSHVEGSPHVKEDELVELDFDASDLAESKIKMDVEDYMVIYKYILGQIKENKIREIEKICDNKNVGTEILDYDDIFSDSEDEYSSSDTESENSGNENIF